MTTERCLQILEVPVAPVELRSDEPFWDQPWIDPNLHAWAFGALGGRELRTYMVIDATIRRNAVGLFDLDTLDLPIVSLFQGEAAKEMAEVAPYLIDLTLPRDSPTRFHRALFTQHWTDGMGILIRSEVDLTTLRAHLRRFTRVTNQNGRVMFFRFWEPGVLADYFGYLAQHRPDRARQIFCCRNGSWINAIAGYAPAMDRTIVVEAETDILNRSEPSAGAFVISPDEEAALYRGVLRGYACTIVKHLATRTDLDLTAETEERVLACILRMQTFGIAQVDHLIILAEWDLTSGAPFESKRPDMMRVLQQDKSEDTKMAELLALQVQK